MRTTPFPSLRRAHPKPHGVGRAVALAVLAALSVSTAPNQAAPLPPSPAIKRLNWAPTNTIFRAAKGSDNWPMTWADDGALYTAYGDGNGFEPFVPEKLSLGFAKITGAPSEIAGKNLRTPSLEQKGQGVAGRKASGLLCVGGVLYLWARNAANAQLAWSADHGATWTWCDWKFTNSFGCPTFLNFGKNYAGARDEFVYVYSPDADSAYEVADRLVLARVHKSAIRNRSAYEFLKALEADGNPVWTRSLAERGAVLNNPRRCYRPSVSYNPALRRYWLVHSVPAASSRDATGKLDTRFRGGLAIYDAPQPWGPWTSAFFVDAWDTGPGDSASFPPKWMSADGRTMYLVFSGDDSFSVRRAEVECTTSPP
ncbi:MAG: DUF4185 domain-containing protein [Verrucomicrobia bacterium]|nr:DUF4185 domain-containing protein [Verrucomicrobiota bacterium]